MKKIFILTAAVAMMFASCTKTSFIDNPEAQKAISFDNFMHKATKATEVTTSNVTSSTFGIQAYLMNATASATAADAFYADETLSYASSAWNTSTTYYWPATTIGTPSKAISFFAYNYGTFAKGSYPTAEPTLTYSVNATAAAQEDVIATCAEYQTYQNTTPNGQVKLQFGHVLSQIALQAKYEFISGETLKYTITKIMIGETNAATPVKQLNPDVTYTFGATPSVTSAGTKTSYQYSVAAGAAEKSVTATNDYADITGTDGTLMLAPQDLSSSNATLKIEYKVEAMDGTTVKQLLYEGTKTAKLTQNWQMGKKYVYQITLTHDSKPITYDVAVTAWDVQTATALSWE